MSKKSKPDNRDYLDKIREIVEEHIEDLDEELVDSINLDLSLNPGEAKLYYCNCHDTDRREKNIPKVKLKLVFDDLIEDLASCNALKEHYVGWFKFFDRYAKQLDKAIKETDWEEEGRI